MQSTRVSEHRGEWVVQWGCAVQLYSKEHEREQTALLCPAVIAGVVINQPPCLFVPSLPCVWLMLSPCETLKLPCNTEPALSAPCAT